MTTPTARRALVETAFAAVMARDVDAVLKCLTPEAVLVDPHYPVTRMEGHDAIADGLRWAFGGMKSMGFEIVRYMETAGGESAAVEVATHHVLRLGNRPLEFPQVFVVDFAGERLSRMQAYEPYGPGGPAALFIGAERLRRRLRRRSRPTPAGPAPVG